MKIKISASLGFANRNEETIEVDDDLTDDEIEEEVLSILYLRCLILVGRG